MVTSLGCWCSYLCVDIYECLQQCNKNADRMLMRLNSSVGLVILSFKEHSQRIWLACGSGSTSVHYIRPCFSASINIRVATFKSYAGFENKSVCLYYVQCFIFIFLIAICGGCHKAVTRDHCASHSESREIRLAPTCLPTSSRTPAKKPHCRTAAPR